MTTLGIGDSFSRVVTAFRSKAGAVTVVLALVGGAFAFGRYSAPGPKVEERVAYRDRVVERVVYRERTEASAQKAEAKSQRSIVHSRRTWKPDGTVVEETQTAASEASATNLVLSSSSLVDASSETARQTDVETLRKEDPRQGPTWRVSALAGVDVAGWVPVYGAAVSRRVIGPVWLGAWGLSSGVGGVSVGLEF